MWPLLEIISSDAAIEAAKNGDIDEMKEMMLEEVGKCSCIAALLEAVMTEEMDMVKNLIAAGVDVNERDKSTGDTGSTALQWAAGIGSWNEEIMNALVAAGANINDEVALQQPGGRTPLQTAARSGDPKTVEYLVKLGARVNAPAASSFGRTALQAAAEFGRDQIVEYLIEKGADVNASSAEYGGRTALEAASENDHQRTVKYLINKGADLKFSSTDGSGCTALNIAIEKGHTEIMAIIYANLGTENCYNLLVSAFKNRDYNVAKAILCTGKIDFNRQNDYGNTPLHLAVKNSWHEIVSLMLEEQANTEIRNTENKTPLHLILHQQDSDMAHIVLQHGASMTGITATDARNLFGMRGRDYGLLLLEQDESTGGRMLNMVGGWSGPSPGFGVPITRPIYTVYHLPMHSEAMLEPAVVSWFWSLGGFRSSLDTGLGLPDFRAVSPNLQLGCYLCFSLCTPRPRDPSKISEISPFIVDQYSCEILWVMRPSSMSDSEQDAKQVLRSVEFYSALDFLWIPEHGVEFVGIFLHHLLAKWDELLKQARLHLTQSRKVLLEDKGESPDLVAVLLKDSQTWTDFGEHLEVQATMCRELLNDFRVNELIREELRGDDPDSTNGINALSRKIDQFEKRCEKEIQLLERKTKEMIELEFNLVSIYEARRSIAMSVSMKRLSWITFVFLPLMFASSLFGMNIDILKVNPSWTWYLIVNVPILFLVLFVWILFKYIPIERWIERTIQDIFHTKSRPSHLKWDEEAPLLWDEANDIACELVANDARFELKEDSKDSQARGGANGRRV